ncbi:hypothetical protein [uncultured Psychroserpens sp.]|uniref:hypothetical protein n=1 Tax=uncultured Psychroserpens sp. TaxID=255436 RepID=UPI0026083723|nr:hypothetical protein [uncultured Psychroserpens sp.]
MKTRILIALIAFFGSFLTSAQNVYNMYPNYQPGPENVIYKLTHAYDGTTRGEISPVMPLEVNGKHRQGSVLSKWPNHNDADIDLYEIKVVNEGVLSIVANPIAYNEKGTLSLRIYGNDNRTEDGLVLKKLSIKSYDSYRRDDGWNVTDSASFYAYPGTYYLVVVGKYGEGQGKYLPLTYQVGVIQDLNVNSYSGNLGTNRGAYNPNVSAGYPIDLGMTALNNNSINVVSSLNIETWMRRSENNRLAKKSAYTHNNSRDVLWFTPSVSGKVYFHLEAFSLDAMDVWQRAWRKFNTKDVSEYPLFKVLVMHKGVKTSTLVDYKSDFKGHMDVVAGGEYQVSISSKGNRPAYYRMYISYSEKIPPLTIGANNTFNNDQSPDDIYENVDIFETSPDDNNQDNGNINDRIELFDDSPNDIRNNELSGIWGNNYIAFQIDSNNASLFQTTDINYWQNYNIDKGSLILKNIQKAGNNKWRCEVMWLFPNTSYVLWMSGIIEMSSDGNSITIIKKNPCDGSLAYQTLNRRIN